MKKHKQTWLAALALAAVAVLQVPASAAITYSDGDIVLAVRATAGVGNTQTYLVDIGNVSQFTGVTGSINVNTLNSLGNLGADLVATFGTGAGSSTEWYNRSDLSWSLFGKDSLSPASIWASKAETTVGTPASPWAALNTTARNGTRNQIASVTATFATATATANSTKAFIQTNALNSASYNYQVTNGGTAFGTLSQWTTSSLEGNFANGSAGTALDLFQFNSSSTPSNLGTFTISNSGVLTFTGTSAVPEPSRALFGMLGMAAMLLRRRRPAARA
ncbi:hypothetical protein [Prosthecobacter vanneervenii]|uniref:PEP-CTERM protein-sorting domain-containing protein n=1 Tax=Prosthecobacter vanneervenii TaxID=48466 RepID=A0A7W7YCP4_9BACT|nr:hypothetical protein [Prosthecobacter vanneervenii]MBB5033761.1 hypothetical protein [Prosthecobacter vanneervenii]